MNDFLNTLDPVALAYCLTASIAAFIGLAIFAYHYSINNFDVGVALGKSLHEQDVFNAENIGYTSGYHKGRESGILIGRFQGQNVGPNTTKTPAKQAEKPSNTRRSSKKPSPSFPLAKKPVKGAKAK
jgi:hypothetical protein